MMNKTGCPDGALVSFHEEQVYSIVIEFLTLQLYKETPYGVLAPTGSPSAKSRREKKTRTEEITMLSNTRMHVCSYFAALVVASIALIPGTTSAASRLDDQKISKARVFHLATTDESGKISLADLYEGGMVTIGSADNTHSLRVTGQALDGGAVQLVLEDVTASGLSSTGETLVLLPGGEAVWSRLASLHFALDEGEPLMSTPEDLSGVLGCDPTTESAVCVKCRGVSYCCNPPKGYCCTVTACGISVRHCH